MVFCSCWNRASHTISHFLWCFDVELPSSSADHFAWLHRPTDCCRRVIDIRLNSRRWLFGKGSQHCTINSRETLKACSDLLRIWKTKIKWWNAARLSTHVIRKRLPLNFQSRRPNWFSSWAQSGRCSEPWIEPPISFLLRQWMEARAICSTESEWTHWAQGEIVWIQIGLTLYAPMISRNAAVT